MAIYPNVVEVIRAKYISNGKKFEDQSLYIMSISKTLENNNALRFEYVKKLNTKYKSNIKINNKFKYIENKAPPLP